MPFYDENYAVVLAEDGNPATIVSLNSKWCAFQNVNTPQRLKLLTVGIWKWGATEDVPYALGRARANPKARPLEASDLEKKPTEKSLPSEVSGCAHSRNP